ncbi:hypothetical protein BGZ58_003396, partial [Dissophora ornata]
ANLAHSMFDSVDLRDADLRQVNFRGSWLHQKDLGKAKMSVVQFGEWPMLNDSPMSMDFVYSHDDSMLAAATEESYGVNIYDALFLIVDCRDINTWEAGHSSEVLIVGKINRSGSSRSKTTTGLVDNASKIFSESANSSTAFFPTSSKKTPSSPQLGAMKGPLSTADSMRELQGNHGVKHYLENVLVEDQDEDSGGYLNIFKNKLRKRNGYTSSLGSRSPLFVSLDPNVDEENKENVDVTDDRIAQLSVAEEHNHPRHATATDSSSMALAAMTTSETIIHAVKGPNVVRKVASVGALRIERGGVSKLESKTLSENRKRLISAVGARRVKESRDVLREKVTEVY